MPALDNLTKSVDIATTSRIINFVSAFNDDWAGLRALYGISRPIRKVPGTVLKSKYAEVTLQTDAVAEGALIPFSKAQVKIDDLARNLIKLSGLKPDVDIKIEYTGLRPGEKLYEEKLMAEEGLRKTENDMIHIGSPILFDADKFFAQLGPLMHDAYLNRSNIRDEVADIVQTYHPKGMAAERPKELVGA